MNEKVKQYLATFMARSYFLLIDEEHIEETLAGELDYIWRDMGEQEKQETREVLALSDKIVVKYRKNNE